MGAILFIILVGVPIGEIVILVKVGEVIGFWETIGAVILTALVGTHLLRQQGLVILKKAKASMDENRFPVDEVFDGLCLLFAGALLLTPGFITDAIGLALFVAPFRAVLRLGLVQVLAARGHLHVHGSGPSGGPVPGGGPIIDGDFEDVTENNGDAPRPGLPGKQADRAAGERPGKDPAKD